MKILVLGATGRAGRATVTALTAGGHEVVAYHRRDVPGVPTTLGTISDVSSLKQALDGVEAVVSALASSNTEAVCSTMTRSMVEASGGAFVRYIIVSGAGVDVPGDAKALPDRLIGRIMKLFVGKMLADRQAEYEMLATSALRWTVIRPPRLTDGPATRRLDWRFDTPASTKLARADLALALTEALTRDDLIGRAPFVSEGKS